MSETIEGLTDAALHYAATRYEAIARALLARLDDSTISLIGRCSHERAAEPDGWRGTSIRLDGTEVWRGGWWFDGTAMRWREACADDAPSEVRAETHSPPCLATPAPPAAR